MKRIVAALEDGGPEEQMEARVDGESWGRPQTSSWLDEEFLDLD